jgi:hypothetical protein
MDVLSRQRLISKRIWLLLIPMVLSAFTHLWNPIGFPPIHVDEAHYLRRSVQVSQGIGPQETSKDFDNPHDHPYFGQLFLASILRIVGFPDSIAVSPIDQRSIETLYLVPRVFMGMLAIFDTFLIYKITERKYSSRTAFIASIIFAVMPISWLLRRVFLDNILLPFLLLSILMPLYVKPLTAGDVNSLSLRTIREKNTILVLLSGIFLGLAMFTKIPASTLIPLVGLLAYTQSNKSLKALGIWFIPVILILSVWPLYNILTGQFDDWMDGIIWQATQRPAKPLSGAVSAFVEMDPVLFLLGSAGLVYSVLGRKQPVSTRGFLVLWILPYVLFMYIIGWVSYFHWIIVLPAFSIAAGVVLERIAVEIDGRLHTKNKIKKVLLPNLVILAIVIFGLGSTCVLALTEVNSSYFQVYAFLAQNVVKNDKYGSDNGGIDHDESRGITMVGHRWAWAFSWIPKYVYHANSNFISFNSTNPINSERFLLLVDDFVKRKIFDQSIEDPAIERTRKLYNDSHVVRVFTEEKSNLKDAGYPYTNLGQDSGIYNRVEIRSNY